MKLYRCENPDCNTSPDFSADEPVCPDCKADGRLHFLLITELVPVHYFAVDKDGPIRTPMGNRRIPCMPKRAKLLKACSGERMAVTCPACKASDVYKGHEAGAVDQHTEHAERAINAATGKTVVQGV